MSLMNAGQARLEQSGLEVQDADGAVRAAGVAISEYLATHENMHRIQAGPNGVTVHLGAMDADPALTALENREREARKQFAHALEKYGKLKKKLQPEEVHVGGQLQS
jgi:hypothetical protein